MGEEIYKAKFTADTKELTKAAKDAESKLSKFTSSVDKFSRKLIIAGGAITAGMGAVIAKTVSAAASVEELQNRTMVTFRESAGMVQKWAATYAEAIGRSRFAMEEQATQLGVLLSAFGLSGDAVAENAVALGKLTSDWESFMNIPASEVLAKIASGLAGEAEALRRLGVDVSAVAVKQELLNRGYEGSIENATQLEKVQARLAIILRGLPDAQGDAARTAGELVNQWRALQGALRDLNVGLGQIFAKDAKTAIGALSDLIRNSTAWLTANKELVGSVASTTVKTGALAIIVGVAGLALTKFIAGARGIYAGAKALRVFGTAVGGLDSKMGAVGLAAAVGVSAVALGNWIGKVTGAHNAIASLIESISRAWGQMAEFEKIVQETEERLAKLTPELRKVWKEQEKLEKVTRKGVITWDEFRKILPRVTRAGLTAKQAIAGLRKETESLLDVRAVKEWILPSIAADSRRVASALDILADRLKELPGLWGNLSEAQETFAEQIEGLSEQLAPEVVFDAQGFEDEFDAIKAAVGALLPEAAAGSADALQEIGELLARLTALGHDYADEMGMIAAEAEKAAFDTAADEEGAFAEAHNEALAKVQEFVEEAGAAGALAMEYAKDAIGDEGEEIERQIDVLEDRFEGMKAALVGIPVTLDTAAAHDALTALDLHMQSLGRFVDLEGRGGTPGEDRLSTSRRPRHAGRQESITTNVNATINIARSGTPSGLAKSVAADIGRMKRRGQLVG